jgi:hypothetical protein
MNNKPCWHIAAVEVMEMAEKPQVLADQASNYDAAAMQAALDADDMTTVGILEAAATQDDFWDEWMRVQ